MMSLWMWAKTELEGERSLCLSDGIEILFSSIKYLNFIACTPQGREKRCCQPVDWDWVVESLSPRMTWKLMDDTWKNVSLVNSFQASMIVFFSFACPCCRYLHIVSSLSSCFVTFSSCVASLPPNFSMFNVCRGREMEVSLEYIHIYKVPHEFS